MHVPWRKRIVWAGLALLAGVFLWFVFLSPQHIRWGGPLPADARGSVRTDVIALNSRVFELSKDGKTEISLPPAETLRVEKVVADGPYACHLEAELPIVSDGYRHVWTFPLIRGIAPLKGEPPTILRRTYDTAGKEEVTLILKAYKDPHEVEERILGEIIIHFTGKSSRKNTVLRHGVFRFSLQWRKSGGCLP